MAKASINAILIEQGKSQSERFVILHDLAVKQLETLTAIGTEGITQIESRNGDKSKRIEIV